jgi:type I restriction enzyme R subunit
MSRRNCVALYDALRALPGCPEIKIVMTGDLAPDPKAWSEVGHITSKEKWKQIKARFVDPADPLRIVIVRERKAYVGPDRKHAQLWEGR